MAAWLTLLAPSIWANTHFCKNRVLVDQQHFRYQPLGATRISISLSSFGSSRRCTLGLDASCKAGATPCSSRQVTLGHGTHKHVRNPGAPSSHVCGAVAPKQGKPSTSSAPASSPTGSKPQGSAHGRASVDGKGSKAGGGGGPKLPRPPSPPPFLSPQQLMSIAEQGAYMGFVGTVAVVIAAMCHMDLPSMFAFDLDALWTALLVALPLQALNLGLMAPEYSQRSLIQEFQQQARQQGQQQQARQQGQQQQARQQGQQQQPPGAPAQAEPSGAGPTAADSSVAAAPSKSAASMQPGESASSSTDPAVPPPVHEAVASSSTSTSSDDAPCPPTSVSGECSGPHGARSSSISSSGILPETPTTSAPSEAQHAGARSPAAVPAAAWGLTRGRRQASSASSGSSGGGSSRKAPSAWRTLRDALHLAQCSYAALGSGPDELPPPVTAALTLCDALALELLRGVLLTLMAAALAEGAYQLGAGDYVVLPQPLTALAAVMMAGSAEGDAAGAMMPLDDACRWGAAGAVLLMVCCVVGQRLLRSRSRALLLGKQVVVVARQRRRPGPAAGGAAGRVPRQGGEGKEHNNGRGSHSSSSPAAADASASAQGQHAVLPSAAPRGLAGSGLPASSSEQAADTDNPEPSSQQQSQGQVAHIAASSRNSTSIPSSANPSSSSRSSRGNSKGRSSRSPSPSRSLSPSPGPRRAAPAPLLARRVAADFVPGALDAVSWAMCLQGLRDGGHTAVLTAVFAATGGNLGAMWMVGAFSDLLFDALRRRAGERMRKRAAAMADDELPHRGQGVMMVGPEAARRAALLERHQRQRQGRQPPGSGADALAKPPAASEAADSGSSAKVRKDPTAPADAVGPQGTPVVGVAGISLPRDGGRPAPVAATVPATGGRLQHTIGALDALLPAQPDSGRSGHRGPGQA